MNNNVCQVKQNILVTLNSKNCTAYYNGNFLSDVEWDLSDILAKPKAAVEFSVSVMNTSIPIGQYNVNSTNNILVLRNVVTDVISTVTITPGNYTITQLIAELTTNTPAEYEYTYTPKINKMSVYNTTHNFQILSTTTMWELLGLQRNTVVTSTFKTYHFPNCVNMSGLQNINIHLDNLNTKNITSFTKAASTIITSVPVDVNSSGVLSYNLSSNYEIPVPISSLDYINILLKDDLGNFIENNGIHWSVTLLFSYYVQQEFNTETLLDKTRNSKLSIYQPQPKTIINEIPKVFARKNTNIEK
jgi:hypothetical protein